MHGSTWVLHPYMIIKFRKYHLMHECTGAHGVHLALFSPCSWPEDDRGRCAEAEPYLD